MTEMFAEHDRNVCRADGVLLDTMPEVVGGGWLGKNEGCELGVLLGTRENTSDINQAIPGAIDSVVDCPVFPRSELISNCRDEPFPGCDLVVIPDGAFDDRCVFFLLSEDLPMLGIFDGICEERNMLLLGEVVVCDMREMLGILDGICDSISLFFALGEVVGD
eukprot:CAMPEP_0194300774 /NCGR_PEP_ID=MMETSP0169-20130528/61443_1 /TAXON_ID=218684 /ORGANISM="Corethron pennatum, Strain L29A3" /LENGTH=162 /DNA_ID=CAMNT_0039050979 /DNA_START=407 /DNA_END=895 /DNA_ORIENTATION=+